MQCSHFCGAPSAKSTVEPQALTDWSHRGSIVTTDCHHRYADDRLMRTSEVESLLSLNPERRL